MVSSSRPTRYYPTSLDHGATSLTTRHDERATLEARRAPATTSMIDPADSELLYLSDWVEGLPERLDLTQHYRELGPTGNALIIIQGEAVFMWDDVDGRYTLGARLSTTPPPRGYKCSRSTLEQIARAERGEPMYDSEPGYVARDEAERVVDRAELLDRLQPYQQDILDHLDTVDRLYPDELRFVNREASGYRRSAEIATERHDGYVEGFERIRPSPMRSLFGAGSIGSMLGMNFAGDVVYGSAPRLARGAYDMNPWPATHGPVSEESDRIASSKAEAKRARRVERNKKLAGGAA